MLRLFRKNKTPLQKAIENGMVIGENVTAMSDVHFGSEPYLIEIGNNVRISFGVVFINHDGGTHVFRHQERYKDVIKFGKIKIGSNVFIGANSILMPGIELGDNCVVGAGSVVTKSFGPNVVIAGNPAKIICSTEEYAERCLKKTPNYDKNEYNKNKKDYLIKLLK